MGMMILPVTDVSVDRYRAVLESHEIIVEVENKEGGFSMICSLYERRRGFGFSITEGVRDGKVHDIWRSKLGADYAKVKGEMTCGVWFQSNFIAPHVCNLLYDAGLLLLQRRFYVPPLPPLCPRCGRRLRAKLAKQCFACGANWRESVSHGEQPT
jgi:hypothetical protein